MSDGILSFVRDFIVDFLGSFLPGMFWMLAVYVGVIFPAEIYLACGRSPCATPYMVSQIIESLNSVPDTRWGAFLVSGIAYLIGLTYSKKTVDWADSASFYYNTKVRSSPGDDPFDPGPEDEEAESLPKTVWSRFCSYFIPEFKMDASLSEPQEVVPRLRVLWSQLCVYLRFKLIFSVVFSFGIPVKGLPRVMLPYNDLHRYLTSIGLETTADDVRWKRADNKKKRAELGMHLDYFNALKMRIQVEYPDAYQAIAYLEAQNRLLASMFYATSHAWLICVFVTVVLACLVVTKVATSAAIMALPSAVALPPAVALALCLFRHRILLVLHKERVREVIRVFDSATLLGSFDKAGVWKSRRMTAAEKTDHTFTD